MTTGWLLLLVMLVASPHSVDNQSTTDDDVCDDGLLRQEIERLSSRQQQIVQQLQFITERLGKLQWKL